MQVKRESEFQHNDEDDFIDESEEKLLLNKASNFNNEGNNYLTPTNNQNNMKELSNTCIERVEFSSSLAMSYVPQTGIKPRLML